MHTRFSCRSIASLLFSACFIASGLTSAPAALAQAVPHSLTPAATTQATAAYHLSGQQALMDAVREAVRLNPALADGVGNQALLEGARNASMAHPHLAESINAAAKQLKPHLAQEIDFATRVTDGFYVQTSPATSPAPVQATTSSYSPAATTGANNVAGGSSGAALTGGIGNTALLGVAGAAVVGAGIAAASGGGSSKSSSGGGGGGPTPPPPPPEESIEYKNQWGLAAIHASDAYARGGTGQAITVAVLDTGLTVTHPDIAANASSNGRNFITNSTDVTDTDGHGSHVAGIIAAVRDGKESADNMHGVAYNSTILPLKVLGTGGGLYHQIVEATRYAVANNAHVLNASYGPDYSDPAIAIQEITAADALEAAAYQDATDAGVILVFAAGNDHNENPVVSSNPTGAGLYPYIRPANAASGVYDDIGQNYDFSALEGMLLAVVATDETGAIASYSSRCGVAADWCLAAPGTNVLSIDGKKGTGTIAMSGTSMAAPHVSGAVAILLQMFPELTPEEVVERLLVSADKSGVYANKPIYGQGFLDLEKATRPIGQLNIATGASVHDGKMVALSGSSLHLGPAFGDGLRASLSGHKLAVFDQQNATFVVDLAQFTRTADSRFNLDESLRRFRSRFDEQVVQLSDASALRYAVVDLGQHSSMRPDPSLDDRGVVMELAFTQQMGDMAWNLNHNMHPTVMFGLHRSDVVENNAMLTRDAFAAPYLSFARQGYSVGTHIPLGERFALNTGMFHGYPLADEMLAPEERAESYGYMTELAYSNGPLRLFSQLGMLTEKNSFLGSRSEGAFDLSGGTHTSFAGVNAAWRLSSQWNLVGSYYRGFSSPQVSSVSLFDSVSDIQTEAFSVGFMGRDIMRKGDSMGFLGNQPLRVASGDARLSLASGRSRSGALYKQDFDVNLGPTGRELNLEAFYHVSLSDAGTQLMSSLMYRSEPGHIEQAPDEGVFLLQFRQPF